MSRAGAWGRHWWAWAVPSLVLVANLAWIIGFRTAVLQRGTRLGSQVELLESDVARLEAAARKQTETRRQLGDLRTNLDVLRREQLSGMRGRLIPFLEEIMRLGVESGLGVERISYSYTRNDKSGLVYFTGSYRVKGTYEQIRKCVYLMETSPQFIVLEGLALRTSEASASLEIAVELTMGTYFSEVDEKLIRELGIKEVQVGSQN